MLAVDSQRRLARGIPALDLGQDDVLHRGLRAAHLPQLGDVLAKIHAEKAAVGEGIRVGLRGVGLQGAHRFRLALVGGETLPLN